MIALNVNRCHFAHNTEYSVCCCRLACPIRSQAYTWYTAVLSGALGKPRLKFIMLPSLPIPLLFHLQTISKTTKSHYNNVTSKHTTITTSSSKMPQAIVEH